MVKGVYVGGDAWFGSVALCVNIYKRLNVHSTFIVNNNTSFLPMKVLYKILQVRFGDHQAGHWVTISTEIFDVPIFVVSYAWSQIGVLYMI